MSQLRTDLSHAEGWQSRDWKQTEVQLHRGGSCWIVGCLTGYQATVTPSICKPEGEEAYKKEEEQRWWWAVPRKGNGVITPLSCDIWQRLQAWDLVYATVCPLDCLCTVTSLSSQHHIVKSPCQFVQGAVTDTRGATLTLTPPRWAAAEDHGLAVAAQAPQRLPAPVDLHQSRCRWSLLLPGCSNAAPARPATLLPPRVGGKRAPTTSARRRERGETERGNWGD